MQSRGVHLEGALRGLASTAPCRHVCCIRLLLFWWLVAADDVFSPANPLEVIWPGLGSRLRPSARAQLPPGPCSSPCVLCASARPHTVHPLPPPTCCASQLVGAVVKALQDSPLSLSPTAEGSEVLVKLPRMTQEAVERMVKLVAVEVEGAHVSIRRARGKGMDAVKRAYESGSSDEKKRVEKEVGAARTVRTQPAVLF